MKNYIFYFALFFVGLSLPAKGMVQNPATFDQLFEAILSNTFDKDQLKKFVEAGGNVNTPYRGTTLLHEAVVRNNFKAVQLLVEQGADITAYDSRGRTPFYIAAGASRLLPIAQFFLTLWGPDLEIILNAQDKSGQTPLHLAIRWNNDAFVESLLKKHVKTDIKDNDGNTPLHLAAINKKPDIVRLLLKYDAQTYIKNKNGKTPLQEAKDAYAAEIIPLLESAMITELTEHTIETTQRLISEGANINITDEYGFTPLHFAVLNNNLELLSLLIQHGAHVNATTLKGKYTPLHFAATAALNNEKILPLLIKAGADLNAATSSGQTPLHLAVTNGNANIVTHLIHAGADLTIKNKQQHTPIILAEHLGNKVIINTIRNLFESEATGAGVGLKERMPTQIKNILGAIKTGSLKQSDLNLFIINNAPNFTINSLVDGQTLLHHAILSNNPAIVEIVLSAGANPNTKNSVGQTPLFVAAARNNENILQLLLAKGADPDITNPAGLLPLDVAQIIKNPYIITLLENAVKKEAVKTAPIIAIPAPTQESGGAPIQGIHLPPRRLEWLPDVDIFKKPSRPDSDKPTWDKPFAWFVGTPLGSAALAYFGYLIYPTKQAPSNLDQEELYIQLMQALEAKNYEYAYKLAQSNLITTKSLPAAEQQALKARLYKTQIDLVDEAAQNAVSLDPRKQYSRNSLAIQLRDLTNLLYIIDHINP